jgi:nitric oxide reductase NorE protein
VEGVWVFIGADSVIFCILFGSFMHDRMAQPALFENSRHALNFNFGGIDTLILLTSSWFVALAVSAARKDQFAQVSRFLAGGLVTGVLFMVSKSIEYGEKFAAGITPATNNFFMWYFTLTGIHLIHVLVGSCLIATLWVKSRQRFHNSHNMTFIECVASFWHLVDLLWIFLFPLLYLLR